MHTYSETMVSQSSATGSSISMARPAAPRTYMPRDGVNTHCHPSIPFVSQQLSVMFFLSVLYMVK